MKILAIIPARGGSKGIPNKNITDVCGKPLIAYTIEAAKKSKYITRIEVSTDSKEIASTCEKYGVKVPILRPEHLSQDNTPSLPVLQHVVSELEQNKIFSPDIILLLQPTSPLRTSKHIDEAIELFLKNHDADSLVSVAKVPHSMIPESIMIKADQFLTPYQSGESLLQRQKKPTYFFRNGAAIYLTKREKLDQYIWGGKILAYEMDKVSSIDIDDPEDLHLVKAILSYEK